MKTVASGRPRGHRGFTLFEVMVALAVMAFGLIGIAALQGLLGRNADVAKQRTEATRLAQEQMERMRAFTSIAAVAGQVTWDGLAAGNDTTTSNATYTRTWSLAGTTSDPMRRVSVNVAWTDRAGEAQSVTLNSVISKTDPSDVGLLGFPLPQGTTLKRPKNRSLNIPVPAKDLGNGKSVYQLANNFAVVFSNESGYVVMRCNFVVNTASDLGGCSTYSAYIVAGYVSRASNFTFPSGLGISTSALTGITGADCSFEDAYDQNSPDSNGNGVIDTSERVLIAGYKYYLCVLAVPTGGTWSGVLRLKGMSSGTDYTVCRFQYPTAPGLSANARNVQPYSNVNESIDNQNYVLNTAASCPTVNGLASVTHQICRSSNASRTTDCPAT